MNTFFPRFGGSNGALLVIVAGAVAGSLVWVLARLSGIEPEVGRDGDLDPVGLPNVIVASVVAGICAWLVYGILARRGSAVRWWPFIGTTALAISMMGPTWYADGASAVALIAMHLAVGYVLIAGLSWVYHGRHSPARCEDHDIPASVLSGERYRGTETMEPTPTGRNSMPTIEKSIDVNVPRSVAYNQWTQFEDFPRFMEGIEAVKQIDDSHLHWKAKIGGVSREWDAEISEQIPDERIAWHSTGGVQNGGVVTFHYLQPYTTRIMLQVDYEPEGMVETVGDKVGAIAGRTEADLERFKSYIEQRGDPTGAWRGEINNPNAR